MVKHEECKETRTTARLLEKSQEAFVLAVELYNRPSIRYRVEGFAFFICNAWELMLKAKIVRDRGEAAIFYKNNPERTLGMDRCMDLVLTNDKDPLKRNLKDIVRLRNEGTHFIVEEHEQIYVGLFQACVRNYDDKLFEWHGLRISDRVPQHFLTLSMSASPISPEVIRAKYPPKVAERFLFDKSEVEQEEAIQATQRYSFVMMTEMAIVKNPNKADFTVAIDNSSDKTMRAAKVFQDPHSTHPLSVSKIIELVNRRLDRDGIRLTSNGKEKSFTSNDWKLFMNFYDLKHSRDYAYCHQIGRQTQYTYSMRTVDMIVERIKENPSGVIDDLKGSLGRAREADPRGKGF